MSTNPVSSFSHEDFIAASHAIKAMADSHGYGWVLTESVAETIAQQVFAAIDHARSLKPVPPKA